MFVFRWVRVVIPIVLATTAFSATANGQAGHPVPLFVVVEPSDVQPMPQFGMRWSAEVNEEAIRQPAQTIRLNGPGFPETDVELLRWSPRAGYLEMYNKEDPDRPLIIPDPTARPEDFSWNWYGKSGHVTVSLTVERGVLAGRIWLRDRRFALRPSAGGCCLPRPIPPTGERIRRLEKPARLRRR